MIPPQIVLIPLVVLFKNTIRVGGLFPLILASVGFRLPFTVYILWGFIREIPLEMEEAALIDGCNRFQILRLIIVPLSVAALVTVIIFVSIGVWNEFLFAVTFVRDYQWRTLPLGLMIFFGEYGVKYSSVFAALTITVTPTITIYLFLQRHIIRGMMAGSIKG
jgi:ABC-type glycerol-3-phosphate transport system permease component